MARSTPLPGTVKPAGIASVRFEGSPNVDKRKLWVLIIGIGMAVALVALANPVLFEWDTDVGAGDYDDATNWISSGTGYPDDDNDQAVIQGKPSNYRVINLVDACILDLTLSKNIEFHSKNSGTYTLSAEGGITINGTSTQEAIIVLDTDTTIKTVAASP
ncbi:MAG: hypothetical protein C4547_14865 [Phycisphaerales bacterium]|nr:MAG: hypothetical protein C4547_14865 [Phycisphaerales bacterium]